MKRLIVLAVLMTSVSVILGVTSSWSFNPITHIFIAEQVFSGCYNKIDLYYGSIAPDLALYVTDPDQRQKTFIDTHYESIDLRSYAWGSVQRAFSKGWLTHNEVWGADHFAHAEYSLNDGKGYVYEKAEALNFGDLDQTGEFAHYVIEATIDLLLKWREYDENLGKKLLRANLLRSWQDRFLLTKVLVWRERTIDWPTLVSAERTFRSLVGRYGMALALPYPLDVKALIELGVQLAQELYGITVTPQELRAILVNAISLCAPDYGGVINEAIESIESHLE